MYALKINFMKRKGKFDQLTQEDNESSILPFVLKAKVFAFYLGQRFSLSLESAVWNQGNLTQSKSEEPLLRNSAISVSYRILYFSHIYNTISQKKNPQMSDV